MKNYLTPNLPNTNKFAFFYFKFQSKIPDSITEIEMEQESQKVKTFSVEKTVDDFEKFDKNSTREIIIEENEKTTNTEISQKEINQLEYETPTTSTTTTFSTTTSSITPTTTEAIKKEDMNINDFEKEVGKQIQNTDTETKEIQHSKSKTSFENSLSIFSANPVNNQNHTINFILPDQNTSNYQIHNTFLDINVDITRNSSETKTMEKATDVSEVHKKSNVSEVHKSTGVSAAHKRTDISDAHKSKWMNYSNFYFQVLI